MPVRDFKADSTGDIDISGGDFHPVGGDTNAEQAQAVMQGIAHRVCLILGEYWLDESKGVDYPGQVLGKGKDLVVARDLIRAAIADTPDVRTVLSSDIEVGSDRVATVNYKVDTTFSTTPISGSIEVPLP